MTDVLEREAPRYADFAQIVEADKANARGRERAEYDGLEVLSYRQQQLVFDWIGEHVEKSKYTDWHFTSNELAIKCAKGTRAEIPRVTNLMMKTAMVFCGYVPVCESHEIWHFKSHYKRRA